MASSATAGTKSAGHEVSLWIRVRQVEMRQWWLWASAFLVTLLLIGGMASFSFLFEQSDPTFSTTLRDSIRGLLALAFLFDFYTIYQQIEIHRIRRQLSKNEAMYRMISENAEDLISIIDREGRRLYNSPSYGKIFGYSHEELQAVPVVDQIHPEDRPAILAARHEIFSTGVTQRLEYRFRNKAGDWRIMESNGAPIKNHRGEVERLLAVSRDITDRRRAEEMLRQRDEQLRQAQKMEAVGRLSGGIAHDFNNLLAVIIGYSEAIEDRLSPDDSLRKSVGEIRKAGERAAALTNQLLAFSRRQVLQVKDVDLNAVVTDMGTMLRRLIGVDVELTTRLASQLGMVKADQSQLEQIIVNLAVNARDAMPEGGKLLIETSNIHVDEDHARKLPFLSMGPHVVLTVTDTGVGMDSETVTHIFEPFFTTKAPGKGTGLGLATVYGVVKQSGGVVGVESELGRGSKFKIFLPLATKTAGAPVPEAPSVGKMPCSGTILLVEDEEALLNLTADVLSECGFKILTARDGIQALEIARVSTGPIDLLLTDVAMPKLSGPALASYMTHLRPDTRVLFMTGHAERGSKSQAALPAGAPCLQKPFSREALISQVRQLMEAIPQQVAD